MYKLNVFRGVCSRKVSRYHGIHMLLEIQKSVRERITHNSS